MHLVPELYEGLSCQGLEMINLPRECFGVVENIRAQVLVQGTDGLHVIIGERERHDFQILGKVVGLGSWNRNQPSLHNPAEHHLRGGLLVFLS